ncbi:YidC/Oxa1 family insertase periplasmic-domain containing protein, partial [Acinetobacter baumannii]
RPLYAVEKTSYTLADAKGVQDQKGQSEKVLSVPMVFKTPEGVEIIKTFTFTQGQYPIVVSHQVINRSQQNWQGQMFGQLKR